MQALKNDGWRKFNEVDERYFEYIDQILGEQIPAKDLIYQFPAYVGHVNLARFLFFYDLYKKTIELNWHITDVGTWKGASFNRQPTGPVIKKTNQVTSSVAK
jgi:hypothetical protein